MCKGFTPCDSFGCFNAAELTITINGEELNLCDPCYQIRADEEDGVDALDCIGNYSTDYVFDIEEYVNSNSEFNRELPLLRMDQ